MQEGAWSRERGEADGGDGRAIGGQRETVDPCPWEKDSRVSVFGLAGSLSLSPPPTLLLSLPGAASH